MAKREKFAVINPFNLFPDGDVASKVVAIGIAEYAEGGGMAVFMGFANGEGQPISVNLPGQMQRLDADEFYLKNWTEMKKPAEMLIQHGLVAMVPDKEPADSGHVKVPIARLIRSALREMTEQEKQLHP